MKYYVEGKFLFVDMNTPYKFAVMEGDRVITCQQTRAAAEADAAAKRRYRKTIIEQFDRALHLPEVTKIGYPKDRLSSDIRADYQSDAELYAAIQRQKRTLQSIRVVPLEIEE